MWMKVLRSTQWRILNYKIYIFDDLFIYQNESVPYLLARSASKKNLTSILEMFISKYFIS